MLHYILTLEQLYMAANPVPKAANPAAPEQIFSKNSFMFKNHVNKHVPCRYVNDALNT